MRCTWKSVWSVVGTTCGCWGPIVVCPRSRWWPRGPAGRYLARRRSWPRPVCRRARNRHADCSNSTRSRPKRRPRKRRPRLRATRVLVGCACRRHCHCRRRHRRNHDGAGGTADTVACCCCDYDNAAIPSSYDGHHLYHRHNNHTATRTVRTTKKQFYRLLYYSKNI